MLWQNQTNGVVGSWLIKNGVYTDWANLGSADPNVWKIVGVGDFNGDGTSDVLWQNQTNGVVGSWLIKNGVYTDWANLGGADPKVWKVVGNNQNGYVFLSSAVSANSTVSANSALNVSTLTQSDLYPIINEAIARLRSAGLDSTRLVQLSRVQFVITDLSGSKLSMIDGNLIYIDNNAAGHGWFVDRTPTLDEEFSHSTSDHRLHAVDPRAVDRIDLLSVVERELGYIAGINNLDAMFNDIMSGALSTGIRLNLHV